MYNAIAQNKRRTVFIMVAFILLIAGLGWLLDKVYGNGSPDLFIFILVCGLVYALISYFTASKVSLAVNGAQEIEKKDNPRLYRIIENISITDGLPMPKVYIMEDPAPNAFATGRDPSHSSVCVTSGLLDIMTDTELEAVIAHELGHIKNYDIRVSMIAFAMVAVIGILADFMLRLGWFSGGRRNRDNNGDSGSILLVVGIIGAILAPIVATAIQLAISRQREYLADATSAMTTRYPEGLITALQKIENAGSALQKQNTATAHFFFANPLKGKSMMNLFSTHPPIEDRIARLKLIGSQA